jgi:hypothetical protein
MGYWGRRPYGPIGVAGTCFRVQSAQTSSPRFQPQRAPLMTEPRSYETDVSLFMVPRLDFMITALNLGRVATRTEVVRLMT